jgi:hypothetical protein
MTPMPSVTIISDEVRVVDGRTDGERLLVAASDLSAAIGWELKPEGLCQGDICVPVRDVDAMWVGDDIDIAGVATALGRPAVVDAGACIAVVGLPSESRRAALDGLRAPSFTLPDLDDKPHSLEEWRGKKVVLAAFATW